MAVRLDKPWIPLTDANVAALAGHLGVAIASALVARGMLTPDGGQYVAQPSEVWQQLGVQLPQGRTGAKAGSRPFARACLDWTERKPHVAGPLGKMILTHTLEQGWVARIPGARGLEFMPVGYAGFDRLLGIMPGNLSQPDV